MKCLPLFSALLLVISGVRANDFPNQIDCVPAKITASQPTKLFGDEHKADLAALAYPAEIVGYGEKGRHVQKISQEPFIAFEAFEGQLLGGNRGEWGGELIFKAPEKRPVKIIDDNVVDIYQMPFGIIVLTGIAHLSLNEGSIYIVTKDASDKVVAKQLHGLPGWPARSCFLSSGDLLIGVMDGYQPTNDKGVAEAAWRWLSLGSAGDLRPVVCESEP
jgi:hypothetical protein